MTALLQPPSLLMRNALRLLLPLTTLLFPSTPVLAAAAMPEPRPVSGGDVDGELSSSTGDTEPGSRGELPEEAATAALELSRRSASATA